MIFTKRTRERAAIAQRLATRPAVNVAGAKGRPTIFAD